MCGVVNLPDCPTILNTGSEVLQIPPDDARKEKNKAKGDDKVHQLKCENC